MGPELWKPIKGYEGLYEVSNQGKVRNTKTQTIKVLQRTANGYSQVLLWTKHHAKGFLVHRLVAEGFILNERGCDDVNHIDGNKENNAAENLEWCTRSENIKHAYKTGLRTASSQLLRLEDVKFIRSNPTGLSRKELAKRFNVSYWCICNVLQGKCFREV